MKQINSLIATLLLLVCLPACTERIFLDNEGTTPRLVIIGLISNTPAPYQIYLQNSSGKYFAPPEESMNTAYTGGAEVWLDEELLVCTNPGIFHTRSNFQAQPGKKHTLTVRCDYNQDGRIEEYKASTVAPPIYKLDSISLLPVRSGSDFPAMLMLHYQDNIGKDYLCTYLTIAGKLYSDRILRFGFLANELLGDKDGAYRHVPVSNWILQTKGMDHDNDSRMPIYRYDELLVDLVAMCSETHTFMDAARTQLGQSNPLFFGPRANLPTNFSGGALGLFGSYTMSNASLVVTSSELPEREK